MVLEKAHKFLHGLSGRVIQWWQTLVINVESVSKSIQELARLSAFGPPNIVHLNLTFFFALAERDWP